MRTLALICLLIATPSFAGPTPYKIDGVDFEMSIPEGWISEKDFLGTPLMILGPRKNETRPVIIVIPTLIKPKGAKIEEIEKSQGDYFKGRAEWLARRSGVPVGKFPYQHQVVARGPQSLELHSIGHRFEHQDVVFDQYTHYAVCSGKLFYVSTLLNQNLHQEYSQSVSDIVKSLRCK